MNKNKNSNGYFQPPKLDDFTPLREGDEIQKHGAFQAKMVMPDSGTVPAKTLGPHRIGSLLVSRLVLTAVTADRSDLEFAVPFFP